MLKVTIECGEEMPDLVAKTRWQLGELIASLLPSFGNKMTVTVSEMEEDDAERTD